MEKAGSFDARNISLYDIIGSGEGAEGEVESEGRYLRPGGIELARRGYTGHSSAMGHSVNSGAGTFLSVLQAETLLAGHDLYFLLVKNDVVEHRVPGFKLPGRIAEFGQQAVEKPRFLLPVATNNTS